MIHIVFVLSVENGEKASHLDVLDAIKNVGQGLDMSKEVALRRICYGCDKHVSLTNKHHKDNWYGLCRDCKYIMEIFSFNGNRLEHYA